MVASSFCQPELLLKTWLVATENHTPGVGRGEALLALRPHQMRLRAEREYTVKERTAKKKKKTTIITDDERDCQIQQHTVFAATVHSSARAVQLSSRNDGRGRAPPPCAGSQGAAREKNSNHERRSSRNIAPIRTSAAASEGATLNHERWSSRIIAPIQIRTAAADDAAVSRLSPGPVARLAPRCH